MRTQLEAEVRAAAALVEVAPSEPDPEMQRALRDLENKLTLFDLMGQAGVRGSRLASMHKIWGDQIEFLDDGRPLVKATADPDVLGYFERNLYAQMPEWYEPRRRAGSAAVKAD